MENGAIGLELIVVSIGWMASIPNALGFFPMLTFILAELICFSMNEVILGMLIRR